MNGRAVGKNLMGMLWEMERMIPVPPTRHRDVGTALGWSMDVRLDAYPGSLRIARKIAATAALTAGATRMAAFELETALGEALTNAFLHAYGGDPRGRIVIRFEFVDGGLRVTVRDGGRTLHAIPPIPKEVTPGLESGRGLYLMSRLMDDVEVIHPDRRGRGTAIRMTKRLSAN